MFIPHDKTMAVGQICGMQQRLQVEANNAPSCTFALGYHNISGFFGCSGSMIAIFKNRDIDDPAAVGICEFSKLFLRHHVL